MGAHMLAVVGRALSDARPERERVARHEVGPLGLRERRRDKEDSQ